MIPCMYCFDTDNVLYIYCFYDDFTYIMFGKLKPISIVCISLWWFQALRAVSNLFSHIVYMKCSVNCNHFHVAMSDY